MADASTGGGGLIGGAADPNQPKCFGCCCFMRCGVVVGEILCIVWFTLNLLLGIFGILGATQPNDVARDAGLFCTLPDPVRAVYTDATCFGYDMCDCGGSICTEESFAGAMSPGRTILPIVGWIISLVWVVNAIVGLIAVCKHRYPLLRIVGFWKIAMIVIALLGWVSTVATNGGGRQANHAADSYWRVWGAQQCAEWGSGLLPLENDLSGCAVTLGIEAVGCHQDRFAGGAADEAIVEDITYFAWGEPHPGLNLFDLSGYDAQTGYYCGAAPAGPLATSVFSAVPILGLRQLPRR